jgi:hypothetical protein
MKIFRKKLKIAITTNATDARKTSSAAVLGLMTMMMISSIYLSGGGLLSAYGAATTETQSFFIQLEDFVHPVEESECSEDIHLTGQLHIVTHTTVTDNGITTVKTNANPQGVTGYGTDPETGEPTGTTYQGTGVTSTITKFKPGEEPTRTLIINFNLIGHGSKSDTDSIHHVTAFLTLNAEGEVTSEDIVVEINDCR